MSKSIISLIIVIFFTGLIAGAFTGVSIKTGQPTDPNAIMASVIGLLCNSINDSGGKDITKSCNSTYNLFLILIFLIGILEIVYTSSIMGGGKIGFIIGLIIYGAGWLYGLSLV